MEIKKFPCTQQELYAVCAAAWSSCKQHLEKFTNLRPMYTLPYVDARMAEIRTTSQMPDSHIRNSRQEITRLDLKKTVVQCLDAWKLLKVTIEELWPKAEQSAALKAAGSPFYTNSYYLKWEACISLMENAQLFIKDHIDKLGAPEVLGPQFQANFDALVKSFLTMHQAYMDEVNNAGNLTDEKLKANNRLYTDLQAMFKIAKIAFRDDPVTLRKFMFESVLSRVSGTDSAGIKGQVTNGEVPVTEITGLKLLLAETGEEAQVEEGGVYRFSRLPVGQYTVKASAPGYKLQDIPAVDVRLGAYTTLNIRLEKETAGSGLE